MEAQSAGSSSGGSYDPVLINPTSGPVTPPLRATVGPPVPRGIRFKRAYPLGLLAVLDFGYSVRHIMIHATSRYLLVLAILRGMTMGVFVSWSKRWTGRGGWVAAVSGISIIAVVWELCQGVLTRTPRDGSEAHKLHSFFLLSTALIAACEFLCFVVLLRLSPPSHRIHPLSLRLPPSAVQTPTAFRYQSTNAPISPYRAARHSRHASHHTMMSDRQAQLFDIDSDDDDDDEGGEQPRYTQRNNNINDHDNWSENFEIENDGAVEDEDGDIKDESDTSSISESSIIDLPPPMEPSRIIPPSISMNGGLARVVGGVVDSSPVLGPLVRRSRSARFLGRSWGSQAHDEEGQMGGPHALGTSLGAPRPAFQREGSDYGTFSAS